MKNMPVAGFIKQSFRSVSQKVIIADDCQTFCLIEFNHKQDLLIRVFDSKNNKYLFSPRLADSNLNLYNYTDISPNSKWLLTISGLGFLLVDIESQQHVYLDLGIESPLFARFLDDDNFIVLCKQKLHIVSTEGKIVSNTIQKIVGCKDMFVNKKDKKIMISKRGAENNNCIACLYEMSITDLQWKLIERIESKEGVSQWPDPRFPKIIEFIADSQTLGFDLRGYSAGDIKKFNEFCNYSELEDYIGVRVKQNDKVCIGDFETDFRYLFRFGDKIICILSRGYLNVSSVGWIYLDAFEFYKLAKIITHGFYIKNAWNNFLTRGLYDPRLFLTVYEFIKIEKEDIKKRLTRDGVVFKLSYPC